MRTRASGVGTCACLDYQHTRASNVSKRRAATKNKRVCMCGHARSAVQPRRKLSDPQHDESTREQAINRPGGTCGSEAWPGRLPCASDSAPEPGGAACKTESQLRQSRSSSTESQDACVCVCLCASLRHTQARRARRGSLQERERVAACARSVSSESDPPRVTAAVSSQSRARAQHSRSMRVLACGFGCALQEGERGSRGKEGVPGRSGWVSGQGR